MTCATPFEPRTGYSLLVFHDRLWVIGGGDKENDVWSSADGLSWTLVTGSAAFSPRTAHNAVVFDNRMWVIGGIGEKPGPDPNVWLNDVWYSGDGITWIEATGSAPFAPRSSAAIAVFGNRIWLIGGNSNYEDVGDVWSSADGINWTLATATPGFSARSRFDAVVFHGELWILGGYSMYGAPTDIWHSADGVTWTRATTAAPFVTTDVNSALEFNGSLWVIPDQRSLDSRRLGIWHSSDGIHWVEDDPPPASSSERPPSYTINYGLYYESQVIRFRDTLWFFREYVTDRDEIKNDVWYASPRVFQGKPPTARFTPDRTFGMVPLKIAFTDGSVNGPTSWEWDFGDGSGGMDQNPLHTYSSAGNYTVHLTVRNDFGRDSATFTVMADPPGAGKKWIRVTEGAAFSPRFTYPAVAHDGKMWVIGGGYFNEEYNDVWYTADGSTWTEATGSAPFTPRGLHALLSYQGKLWVIGGLSRSYEGLFQQVGTPLSDVWSSPDGVTWSRVTGNAAFPPRCGHASLVFGDKMWVMGGRGDSSIPTIGNLLNDVWVSSDGVTWNQVEGTQRFDPSDELVPVVFHDEMWMVDGRSSKIWHSPDGANWTLATRSPFTGEDGFHMRPVVVAFEDRIWLIVHFNSGFVGGSQVLYSHDGVAWAQVADLTPVDVKYDEIASTAVVMDDRIWVTRSYLDRLHIHYADRNDVWYSGTDSYNYPDVPTGTSRDIVTLIMDIIRDALGFLRAV